MTDFPSGVFVVFFRLVINSIRPVHPKRPIIALIRLDVQPFGTYPSIPIRPDKFIDRFREWRLIIKVIRFPICQLECQYIRRWFCRKLDDPLDVLIPIFEEIYCLLGRSKGDFVADMDGCTFDTFLVNRKTILAIPKPYFSMGLKLACDGLVAKDNGITLCQSFNV